MLKRAVSGIVLLLLLSGVLVFGSCVFTVKADGTIYIRADGSVEGTTYITSDDNVTYVLTADINNSVVVERSNIVVDGNGHTVESARVAVGDGFNLTCSHNTTVKNTVIKGFGCGVRLDDSSNNTVTRNHITWAGYGVSIQFTYEDTVGNHIIDGNNIEDAVYGVWLSGRAANSTIVENNITNNVFGGWGIYLFSSGGNIITENTITNNSRGMEAWASSNNTITGNIFAGNGLDMDESYANNVEGNLVNGKPLVFLDGASHQSVGDAGQVILVNCEYMRVENLNLSYADVGLQLLNTNHTTVSGNNITDLGGEGIRLEYSSNNTITGNSVTNSTRGIRTFLSSYNTIAENNMAGCMEASIYLATSSDNAIMRNNMTTNGLYGLAIRGSSKNNTVYENNFVGTVQYDIWTDYQTCNNTIYHNNLASRKVEGTDFWDNGIEGNYWSSYSGRDSNHDGIGDSQYVFDEDNADRFPLMGPFSAFNTSLSHCVNVISNSTIDDFQFFDSNQTIRMHVSEMKDAQTHGFCRVSIPHSLMNASSIQVQVDDGLNATLFANYTLYDNGTHRWIYFAYEHSGHEIIIIPEFPLFLLESIFMMAAALVITVCRRKRTGSGRVAPFFV